MPSNTTSPLAGIIPDSARSVVVLPAPLAPSTTTISPASTVQVEAGEHLDRSVAGGEAGRPTAGVMPRLPR